MHIYKITLKYHVTGVLKPESVGQLQRLGIVKIICNRPDSEAPVQEQSEQMRIAVTEAGMAFGYNPVTMTSFSPKLVRRHTDAVLNTNGGDFAYCATGRRRTMLWAFEFAHQRAPEDFDTTQAAHAGMDIASMQERLERIYHSGRHY
jgi:uncharacterized protein (TIGR01244 family)